jgi:hypothetical protein
MYSYVYKKLAIQRYKLVGFPPMDQVLVGAGLPILPELAGESKSYAERLFSFPDVGALSGMELGAVQPDHAGCGAYRNRHRHPSTRCEFLSRPLRTADAKRKELPA